MSGNARETTGRALAKIAIGSALSLTLFVQAGAADAAEITVALAVATVPIVDDLKSAFEQSTGHTLVLAPGTAGAVVERIRGGEAADVVLVTQPQITALITEGKIAPDTSTAIATSGVGVMVRAGAPKPDISSADALRRTLLAASSIAYADPAGGGASGIHFAAVLQRLGIAADIAPKAKLVPVGGSPTAIAEVVARGEAEIGIAITSVIVGVPGVDLVGPLPGDLQSTTVYTAGIGSSAAQPEAARALIDFLAGPAAEEVIRSKGMEPG